jgi:hypothetical protein
MGQSARKVPLAVNAAAPVEVSTTSSRKPIPSRSAGKSPPRTDPGTSAGNPGSMPPSMVVTPEEAPAGDGYLHLAVPVEVRGNRQRDVSPPG